MIELPEMDVVKVLEYSLFNGDAFPPALIRAITAPLLLFTVVSIEPLAETSSQHPSRVDGVKVMFPDAPVALGL